MKRRKQTARYIHNKKYSKQWYISRNLAALATKISELPDAAQAIRSKPRSAPPEMLLMVF